MARPRAIQIAILLAPLSLHLCRVVAASRFKAHGTTGRGCTKGAIENQHNDGDTLEECKYACWRTPNCSYVEFSAGAGHPGHRCRQLFTECDFRKSANSTRVYQRISDDCCAQPAAISAGGAGAPRRATPHYT